MTHCQPLLVFDGDDTLWASELLYDRAREAVGKVVQKAGLDPVVWDKLQRQIDVENVNVPKLGLSSRRFPTSCRQAYWRLCSKHGFQPDESIAEQVYRVAASVFEAKAPLMPDVEKVLGLLSRDAVLVLLTKGDSKVQNKRITDSGLLQYFAAHFVVRKKTKSTFVELAQRFNVPPERSWSIGNSLPSDISPAVRAGWRAIWIDAHVWEHEQRGTQTIPDGVVKLPRLTDVRAIVRTTHELSGPCLVGKGQTN